MELRNYCVSSREVDPKRKQIAPWLYIRKDGALEVASLVAVAPTFSQSALGLARQLINVRVRDDGLKHEELHDIVRRRRRKTSVTCPWSRRRSRLGW